MTAEMAPNVAPIDLRRVSLLPNHYPQAKAKASALALARAKEEARAARAALSTQVAAIEALRAEADGLEREGEVLREIISTEGQSLQQEAKVNTLII